MLVSFASAPLIACLFEASVLRSKYVQVVLLIVKPSSLKDGAKQQVLTPELLARMCFHSM